jgi:hypothetical protein
LGLIAGSSRGALLASPCHHLQRLERRPRIGHDPVLQFQATGPFVRLGEFLDGGSAVKLVPRAASLATMVAQANRADVERLGRRIGESACSGSPAAVVGHRHLPGFRGLFGGLNSEMAILDVFGGRSCPSGESHGAARNWNHYRDSSNPVAPTRKSTARRFNSGRAVFYYPAICFGGGCELSL